MHFRSSFIALLALACFNLCPAPQAAAHGEFDEAELEEFQLHLDDYRAEVETLAAELEPIVSDYASKKDVKPQVAALIEHWEDVGVHAVIERKATILYPGVWQALIYLQQTVDGGKPAADVAAAGERVAAALWQGYGAVRLAASQVGTNVTAPVADNGVAPESGPDTVDRIIADLDKAVAAYELDQLTQAEALIHETYMTRFEGLEGDLIEHDPDLVTSLERDFNATLPLLMQQGASMADVQAVLDSMKAQLEIASSILESVDASRAEVF